MGMSRRLVATLALGAWVVLPEAHRAYAVDTSEAQMKAHAARDEAEYTARWKELGATDKEGWGHANLGVSYFNLSRMDDSARELELALELFEQAGDKVGAVAASSFLCLARPTDRRVAGWLAQALEFADAAGDRSRQLGTLTTLAWHHFIRSLWATADESVEAEGFALRLAELAEELGAVDMVVNGRRLLAIMARFSGRLDEAARHAEVLERVVGTVDADSYPWIGRAATFVVRAARGAVGLAPPLAPVDSPDPVVAMSLLVIEAELTVGGRIPEALARIDMVERPVLGPFGDLAGVLIGLALVLAGRSTEALPWVERATGAARALDAPASIAAADALSAEITGESTRLAPAPPGAGWLPGWPPPGSRSRSARVTRPVPRGSPPSWSSRGRDAVSRCEGVTTRARPQPTSSSWPPPGTAQCAPSSRWATSWTARS